MNFMMCLGLIGLFMLTVVFGCSKKQSKIVWLVFFGVAVTKKEAFKLIVLYVCVDSKMKCIKFSKLPFKAVQEWLVKAVGVE